MYCSIRAFSSALTLLGVYFLFMCIPLIAVAQEEEPTPSAELIDPVAARRGTFKIGTGTTKPTIALTSPTAGWTSSMQILIEGSCSDPTADPIGVNINGSRYFIRSQEGRFKRKFPTAKGKNSITVECRNKGGVAQTTAVVDGVINQVPLKVVLTSDTDSAYTDLHIYEPNGEHVFWASTTSPTGGLFFLNNDDESFDQPGYGPYLYVHPAAKPGVYRVDANYWPGGAIQHTLANLDVILNEGTSEEIRKRIRKPLAHPDETQTLAYIVVRPNRLPAVTFIPGQDPDSTMPPEVAAYKKDIEPKIKNKNGTDVAFLSPNDEDAMRTAVVRLALQQSKKMSPLWEPKQRDCAGLIRFAYREALKERTPTQLAKLGIPQKLQIPVVTELARRIFPEYPKLWQVGFLQSGEKKNSEFADAESLLGFNFQQIQVPLSEAKPGDILGYKKDFTDAQPYHLMMVAANAPRGVVVYHTGARDASGIVKVVGMTELYKASDATWIPEANNPNFLGVYRWKSFRSSESFSNKAI